MPSSDGAAAQERSCTRLTSEARRREMACWRGGGRWADDDAWRAVGASSVEAIRRVFRAQGAGGRGRQTHVAAIEWGVGGGPNAFAFRDIVARFYGVDADEENLVEAQRIVNTGGVDVFRPVLLREAPAAVPAMLGEQVDIFMVSDLGLPSPSMDRIGEVLNAVATCTKPGAVGFLRIGYENGAGSADVSGVDELGADFTFSALPSIPEIWGICEEVGLTVVHLTDLKPPGLCATFGLAARGGQPRPSSSAPTTSG